jgi:hypothetical protein
MLLCVAITTTLSFGLCLHNIYGKLWKWRRPWSLSFHATVGRKLDELKATPYGELLSYARSKKSLDVANSKMRMYIHVSPEPGRVKVIVMAIRDRRLFKALIATATDGFYKDRHGVISELSDRDRGAYG